MDTKLEERYNRQIILKGFGYGAQEKLAAAKVLVVGAGGLGCPALQYLVAAGIGIVGIVDDDTVSLSNLHRQILYSTEDIGKVKVKVAAEKLSRLNPGVDIVPYYSKMENNNALLLLREYDLVIDCTDNFATRYMLNDACVLLSKPLVYGAVMQYEGQVAIFNILDHNSVITNYRDLFPQQPGEEELNCNEAGVLGVLPGIIGTMQAAEVIKLIAGIGKPLINRLLTYNILSNRQYEVSITPSSAANELLPADEAGFLKRNYSISRTAGCESVIEIDAEEFKKLREKSSAVIIDVREKGEAPVIHNDTVIKIPMSVFKENISKISGHKFIFVCSHGVRSLHAANILQEFRGSGKEIYSLKGGLSKSWDSLNLNDS